MTGSFKFGKSLQPGEDAGGKMVEEKSRLPLRENPLSYSETIMVNSGDAVAEEVKKRAAKSLLRGIRRILGNIKKKYSLTSDEVLRRLGLEQGLTQLDGLDKSRMERLWLELRAVKDQLATGSWAGVSVMESKFNPQNKGESFRPVEDTVIKKIEREENTGESEEWEGGVRLVFEAQSEFVQRLFKYKKRNEDLSWDRLIIGLRGGEMFLVLVGAKEKTSISLEKLVEELKEAGARDLVFTSRGHVETEERFKEVFIQELLAVLNKDLKIGIAPGDIQWKDELTDKDLGVHRPAQKPQRSQPSSRLKPQMGAQSVGRESSRPAPRRPTLQDVSMVKNPSLKPPKPTEDSLLRFLTSLGKDAALYDLKVFLNGEKTRISLTKRGGEVLVSTDLISLKNALGANGILIPIPSGDNGGDFIRGLETALERSGIPSMDIIISAPQEKR